jgi:hypothetical protein
VNQIRIRQNDGNPTGSVYITLWKTVVRIAILQDVIRSLLKKFKVADNPHKYALYEKCDDLRRDR